MSDGQTIATRLCNQLKKLDKRICDGVSNYNSLRKDADVTSLNSLLWVPIKQHLSQTRHKQAVDFYCRLCWSREEQALVKEEMNRVLQHLASSLLGELSSSVSAWANNAALAVRPGSN